MSKIASEMEINVMKDSESPWSALSLNEIGENSPKNTEIKKQKSIEVKFL